ncbi:MAG: MerR family transcriptional regulator [Prosthecobacter sp.]
MNLTVDLLAEKVTAWCAKHRVVPANGQVATDTNVRTLRYYRTMGLLDAPTEGGGSGYGERHYLQACCVRVLQAEGLPLTRIQSLLFGRSEADLREIMNGGVAASSPPAASSVPLHPETWQTWPLSPEFMLIARRPGFKLTAAQIEAIQGILNGQAS